MRVMRSLSIVVAGWLGACRHSSAEVPTAAQMSEIEGLAHVKFPPSTRVRTWHTERGIDEYLEIKFEMAAGDWPEFLSSSPLRSETLDEMHRTEVGADHDAWDPNKPAHLRAGQVGLPEGKVLNLGFDDSRHDVVVVYLVYFGT
jgi:hypothetical protein